MTESEKNSKENNSETKNEDVDDLIFRNEPIKTHSER